MRLALAVLVALLHEVRHDARVGHELHALVNQRRHLRDGLQPLDHGVRIVRVDHTRKLREERLAVPCAAHDDRRRDIPWGGLHRRTPALEEGGGIVHLECQLRPADVVAEFGGLELERGDDPEVEASPPRGPEQLGVLVVARAHHRTVGEHDLDGAEVVDREAVLAREPSEAASGREPADPHPAVVAGGDRPAVRLERRGNIDPARPRSDPHAAGALVEYLDRVEPLEVDHDPAVVGGPAADAVPTAAHAKRNLPVRPGEGHRGDHFVHGAGAQHQAG